MMFDLIGENNSNELCDTGKDQISMQCLLVLGSSSCKTEIIFDVVDISFDNSPDFQARIVHSAEYKLLRNVCHFQIFLGNLKKYLPQKAVYMVS